MTSESSLNFRQEIQQKLEPMQMFEFSLSDTTGRRSKIPSGHFSKPDVPTGSIFLNKKSETKATKLDNFFRDDFERGKTDKFIVNMKDIGDPLLCKLGKFKIRVIRTFSLRTVADRSNGIHSETFHIVWMLQV